MDFVFHRPDSLGQDLRELAISGVDAILAIVHASKEERDKAVHEFRKTIKILRALVRLVREPLGDDAFDRANEALRDAGRSMSSLRDQRVMLDLAEALAAEAGSGESEEFWRWLAKQWEGELQEAHEGETDGGGLKRASEKLHKARSSIGGWSFAETGFDLVEAGLSRSYRDGRKGVKEAEGANDPEVFHEWRKRAKDLRHQLEMLRGLWPPVLDVMAGEAHRLTDLLGDYHDLDVLRQSLGDQRKGAPAMPKAAMRQVEAKEDELLAEALPLGRRLYAETPRAFSERMEGYFKEWHG